MHTLDLPSKNRTADHANLEVARDESRVVVTKDSDFVDSFFLRGEPEKLLFIATGNISNNDLILLLRSNWMQLLSMLAQGDFVELNRTSLLLHS